MNIHHITKSLFVGAAIAGIGISSSHAKLQTQGISKAQLRDSIKYYVNERYDDLRKCLPKDLNSYIKMKGWDSTNYESDDTYKAWIEEDVQAILDSLFGEDGYLSHFEDEKAYLGSSDDTPEKNLKKFFKAKFSFKGFAPNFLGKAINRKTLNLMRFLDKVASRCGGANYFITSYDCSSLPNKHFELLMDNGMIKEGKATNLGHYLPKWSFIFDNSFIQGVASPITVGVERQVKNK